VAVMTKKWRQTASISGEKRIGAASATHGESGGMAAKQSWRGGVAAAAVAAASQSRHNKMAQHRLKEKLKLRGGVKRGGAHGINGARHQASNIIKHGAASAGGMAAMAAAAACRKKAASKALNGGNGGESVAQTRKNIKAAK
jgi:hypothetical protein